MQVQPRSIYGTFGPKELCRLSLLMLIRAVDTLAQFLARLEMRDVLGGNLYFLARLRIASHARRAIVQAETAKTADFNALTLGQALRHGVQNHLDRQLGVARHELRKMRGKPGDQLRLCHATLLFACHKPGVSGFFSSKCAFESHAEFLVSNLAFNSAPRLVVPAPGVLSCAWRCRASVSSATLLALIDKLIARFLRSTLMIMALTASPSFRCVRMSSTRSRETSEARRYPSTSPSRATTAPFASTDFTLPSTMAPFSWRAM